MENMRTMNRRSFLSAILATACAPAIVRADSLMRIVPRDATFLPIPDRHSLNITWDGHGIFSAIENNFWRDDGVNLIFIGNQWEYNMQRALLLQKVMSYVPNQIRASPSPETDSLLFYASRSVPPADD